MAINKSEVQAQLFKLALEAAKKESKQKLEAFDAAIEYGNQLREAGEEIIEAQTRLFYGVTRDRAEYDLAASEVISQLENALFEAMRNSVTEKHIAKQASE